MSPELEAQKVIAISLGKIASSRIQRGGPKLCKNLLVANLIHKARIYVDDPFQCYYQMYENVPNHQTENETSQVSPNVVDKSDLDVTEVPCRDDDMISDGDDNPVDVQTTQDNPDPCLIEHEDKENSSPETTPEVSSDSPRRRSMSTSSGMSRPVVVPSRCLKRRNSCSERNFDTHRSPKRVCDQCPLRRSSTFEDLSPTQTSDGDSECPVDAMDVEQISTLVSAFSNSFKDFCCVNGECEERKGSLWRSGSVPDMVLCAQQASNVLKMRQQSFETSTPVLA